jgi:hypothetical protein
MDHLVTLAASMTDGIALRTAIDPSLTENVRSPRDDAEWNLLGIGLVALANELLEDALA